MQIKPLPAPPVAGSETNTRFAEREAMASAMEGGVDAVWAERRGAVAQTEPRTIWAIGAKRRSRRGWVRGDVAGCGMAMMGEK